MKKIIYLVLICLLFSYNFDKKDESKEKIILENENKEQGQSDQPSLKETRVNQTKIKLNELQIEAIKEKEKSMNSKATPIEIISDPRESSRSLSLKLELSSEIKLPIPPVIPKVLAPKLQKVQSLKNSKSNIKSEKIVPKPKSKDLSEKKERRRIKRIKKKENEEIQ